MRGITVSADAMAASISGGREPGPHRSARHSRFGDVAIGTARLSSRSAAGTQAALVTVMRILLLMAAVVVLGGSDPVRAQSRPLGGRDPQASAASAADLHRAERMAEQARKRLEQPNKK